MKSPLVAWQPHSDDQAPGAMIKLEIVVFTKHSIELQKHAALKSVHNVRKNETFRIEIDG